MRHVHDLLVFFVGYVVRREVRDCRRRPRPRLERLEAVAHTWRLLLWTTYVAGSIRKCLSSSDLRGQFKGICFANCIYD